MKEIGVHLVKSGAVATLTLRNPQKLNALSQNLWEAIPRRVAEAVNSDARVLIVTGDGKNFCAGADIGEFDTLRADPETARLYEAANDAAFAALRNCPLPVIAKVQGICFGGGFGLAAACDLRIAAENARFSVPAARLGLAYPVEAMADIVASVGAQNAKHLLFTAERFNAEQMADMGFLNQVVTAERLEEVVMDLVTRIADLAPLTHRATKAAIAAALGGDIARAERLGADTFDSSDYAEGRAAFREKRKPRFTGR
ncbi:MAG: enoyl-CoA hydratase-related protein [Ahrensia sp.]|nr:enoyl-CoA hydratase-related protein [Ahrensia sp.]